MGLAIVLIVIAVVLVVGGIAQYQKTKADLAVMPAGSRAIGHGFYYTPAGETWRDRRPVTNAHAEVHATQRHTLTRVATGVGAFTKKTDGTLVISYTGATARVVTKKVSGAAAYRQAMTFAAKLNGVAGTTSQTA